MFSKMEQRLYTIYSSAVPNACTSKLIVTQNWTFNRGGLINYKEVKRALFMVHVFGL